MKKLISILSIMLSLVFLPSLVKSQEAEKSPLVLGLKYYNSNGQTQYLLAQAKSKVDGKFQMISGIKLKFFISDETVASNLVGEGVTNGKGEAIVLVPASAQTVWKSAANQTFILTSEKTKAYDEARTDLSITKAKIKIDTADGRIVNATILSLVDSVWTPMKEVDMFVGVKRLGGNLNVNDTETYPSDSLGSVSAEYKRENLPGDKNGNIILVAGVKDNDTYGSVTAEMSVPWGVKTTYVSNFDERTLFARRGHSPLWLEFIAYGIVAAVWGILIYLIIQIKKIIRLGVE